MTKESTCSHKTKMKMALALKELMNTTSFDKITVSDITEKSGIHRQTFYYHFQDRYELLEWYINKELVEPFIDDFTFDNMYDKFRELLETMNESKRFYQNAMKISSTDLSNYIMRRTKEELVFLAKNIGKANSVQLNDESTDMVFAEFFGFGLAGVILSWAKEGMKTSPEKLTGDIMKIIEICKSIAVQREMKH